MKYVIVIVGMMWSLAVFGQESGQEYYRKLGYEARVKGDYTKAIQHYQKVLTFSADDYDARLALARLYLQVNNPDSAIIFFNTIYHLDLTDAEALKGLGECYFKKSQFETSLDYFRKALTFIPNEVPLLLNLAAAWAFTDHLDSAIAVYRKINTLDATYSESWAGMGKMYYWKGKPHAAAGFYKKALVLDPDNEEIKAEYRNVLGEIKPGITLKVKPINEKEESYEINALISSVKIEKRINDLFLIDANFLLDHSDRNYTTVGNDTTRWYNSAWVKGSLLIDHHIFSLYSGYSATDRRMSSYGLNWLFNTSAGKFTLRNNLTAGYDYFYYWNRVGSSSFNEDFLIGYRFLKFNARYTLGKVDRVTVRDVINDTSFVRNNDYQSYGFSLQCKVISKPEINLGLSYNYLDYQYKSRLYYSPFERNLHGAFITMYYPLGNFYLYAYYTYNIGQESTYEQLTDVYEKVKLNVDNWSTDLEMGYQHYPFYFSGGISRFYNPYYKSLSAFVTVKALF